MNFFFTMQRVAFLRTEELKATLCIAKFSVSVYSEGVKLVEKVFVVFFLFSELFLLARTHTYLRKLLCVHFYRSNLSWRMNVNFFFTEEDNTCCIWACVL